ncbi:MAG: NAD-dependent epimerase/dehydratase family protein [Bacteroidota bacterium]
MVNEKQIIALTGASGHVGANLTRSLIEKSFHVKVLVYRDKRAIEGLDVEIIKGHLLDLDALESLIKGCHYVVHLAAGISISKYTSAQVFETNVKGTENVAKIALRNNVKRMIHFSSIHAFNQFPLDETLTEKRSLVDENAYLYDRSKAEGERIVLNYVSKGLDALIISPTSILGPFDFKPSLMGQVLLKIARNQIPMLVPGGYDWVDVRDVCNATISALHNGKTGEKYLISGSWLSLTGLSNLVGEVLNKKTVKTVCPLWLAKASLPLLNTIDRLQHRDLLYTKESLNILVTGNRNINSSKSQQDLNFTPRKLENTLRDTFDWFRENKYL